ncbi:MAG: FecR family protein [Parabacteroides sp.]|nr:FecR family protein [Parabacteroides sp.]
MKNKHTADTAEELRKATRNLIERIRQEDEANEMKTDWSFEPVMEKVQAARSHAKRRRLYFRIASAAAVLALAFAVNLWYENRHTAPELSIALLNDTVAVRNDEVTLIAGNQALNLKNNAAGGSNAEQYALNKRTMPAPESEMHKIVVPRGKRANVVFSDGTRININSGSQVIYPDVFDKDKREILVSGEVYLDVAENPERPFIVKTKGFDIRVLGTAFNVCAYDRETTASVVLVRRIFSPAAKALAGVSVEGRKGT